MIKKKANVIWKGSAQGKGEITTETGALKNAPYSLGGRFEKGSGTNPEELVAAAHAGCFAMALAVNLGIAGFTADEIQTSAVVSLDKVGDNWTVTESHLSLSAKIPQIQAKQFQEIAEKTKATCPISRLLNTKIALDLKLL